MYLEVRDVRSLHACGCPSRASEPPMSLMPDPRVCWVFITRYPGDNFHLPVYLLACLLLYLQIHMCGGTHLLMYIRYRVSCSSSSHPVTHAVINVQTVASSVPSQEKKANRDCEWASLFFPRYSRNALVQSEFPLTEDGKMKPFKYAVPGMQQGRLIHTKL